MRYARNYAQAQKKEEESIFKCYYRAHRLAKMDGHKKNLELVRENLIDGENDLTIKVWENFLNVCVELDIDMDPMFEAISTHPTDMGKGNGYRIPSKDVNIIEHMKKRQRRIRWRETYRRKYENDQSSNIMQKLQRPVLRAV